MKTNIFNPLHNGFFKKSFSILHVVYIFTLSFIWGKKRKKYSLIVGNKFTFLKVNPHKLTTSKQTDPFNSVN